MLGDTLGGHDRSKLEEYLDLVDLESIDLKEEDLEAIGLKAVYLEAVNLEAVNLKPVDRKACAMQAETLFIGSPAIVNIEYNKVA